MAVHTLERFVDPSCSPRGLTQRSLKAFLRKRWENGTEKGSCAYCWTLLSFHIAMALLDNTEEGEML